MARPVTAFSISGSESLALIYEALEDDYLILESTWKYGSTPGVPSGWTALSFTNCTQNGSGNAVWHRRATASEPTITPTITPTGCGVNHGLQMQVIRGADTVTAFDVTPVSRASGSVALPTTPVITPAQAGALLLYIIMPNSFAMFPQLGPLKISRSGGIIPSGRINSYYSYSAGAGVAVPSINIYAERDINVNPTVIVIAFRDDGSNQNVGYIDMANPPADIIHILGFNGETGSLTGTPEIDLSSTGTNVVPTIQGTTTTYNTNPSGSTQTAFEEGFNAAGYSTGFSTQTCAITASSIATPVDLENEIVSLSSFGDAGMYDLYDAQAKVFGVGDGTNFRLFQIDAIDALPSGSKLPIVSVLEIDGGFESEEHGTVNATVLQNLDTFVMAGPALGTYRANGFGFLYLHRIMTILGGTSGFPSSMEIAVLCSETGSLRTINAQGQQSRSQFYSAHSIQVGNGVIATRWTSRNHALEFPGPINIPGRRIQVKVTAGKFGFRWKASATCYFDIGVCAYNCGNFSPWGPLSGSSTSATIIEDGALVIGATPILYDLGRPWANVTITNSKELQLNDADISGVLLASYCVDPTCITIDSQVKLTKLANAGFTQNSDVAITITGEHSSLTLPGNMYFAGNVTDIEYTGTTTLTLSVPASSNLDTGKVVGNVVIAPELLTLTVDISGATGIFVIHDVDSGDPQSLGTELQRNDTASGNQTFQYASAKIADVISINMLSDNGFKQAIKLITLPAFSSIYVVDLEIETN